MPLISQAGSAWNSKRAKLVNRPANTSVRAVSAESTRQLRKYQAAVSAELGEIKAAVIPAELQKTFDYLTQPMECAYVGEGDGEMAIAALVNAGRFDLMENVLRAFNPNGRIYAARELLKLNQEGRLVLSPDTLAVIAKISNLDIQISRVSGCVVNYMSAKEILDSTDP